MKDHKENHYLEHGFDFDFKFHTIGYIVKIINETKCKRILSVGCGNGFIENVINSCFKDLKIVGIDFDTSRIEYAKFNYPDVEFKLGDITKLDPRVLSNFDLVYFVNASSFIKKEDLVDLYNTLRDNGCKHIIDASGYLHGKKLLIRFLKGLLNMPFESKHYWRSIKEFNKAYLECNLKVVERHRFGKHIITKLEVSK